jgi:hypothetical protein
MKKRDTTVKLDGALVEEVSMELEKGETLTGFVRNAVSYRIRRSRMKKAAEAYRKAMETDPGLAAEISEWEQADLAKPQNSETGDSSV